MKKKVIISVFLMAIFIACSKYKSVSDKPGDSSTADETAKDEVWKQYMKMQVSNMEKMPPDSGCVLILNHKKVSYYKGNQLQFTDDLREYMVNDSLIVYRVNNQPEIQIGYNRKDSVVLFTTGHPEGGGNPTGEMQFFAKKVEAPSPFNK